MRGFVFATLLAIASLASAQTPTDTVNKFLAAWNRRDVDSMTALIKSGKISPSLRASINSDHSTWPKFSISDVHEKVSDSTATVSYVLAAGGAPGTPTPSPRNESANLVKSGSEWLIVGPASPPSGDALIPGLAYLFTHPDNNIALDAARQTACLSNLKQISLGLLMFATDYDDVLKFKPDKYKASITPYIRNADVFTCPLDPKGTVSYSFNAKLAGISMSKIAKPAETVLAYEGKNGVLNFRHKGRATVAFADGHVKVIDKEMAKKLIWNANGKQ